MVAIEVKVNATSTVTVLKKGLVQSLAIPPQISEGKPLKIKTNL